MIEKEVLIYQGSLKIKKSDLIQYLDSIELLDAPLVLGIAIDSCRDKYGEGDGLGIIPQFGFNNDSTKVYTFWHDDIQAMRGQNYIGSLLMQFNIGRIELSTPMKNGHQFTEVSIISSWSPMRSFYEWIAGQLQFLFKERRIEFNCSQDNLLETIGNLYLHGLLPEGYHVEGKEQNESGFIRLEISKTRIHEPAGYLLIGKINNNFSILDVYGYYYYDFLQFFDSLAEILPKYIKIESSVQFGAGETEKQEPNYKSILSEKGFKDTTGWYMTLIELWNDGHQRDYIADRVKVTPDRVTNCVTEFRRIYGVEVMPYNTERKKRLIKSRDMS
jgi:hypothetical protein